MYMIVGERTVKKKLGEKTIRTIVGRREKRKSIGSLRGVSVFFQFFSISFSPLSRRARRYMTKSENRGLARRRPLALHIRRNLRLNTGFFFYPLSHVISQYSSHRMGAR